MDFKRHLIFLTNERCKIVCNFIFRDIEIAQIPFNTHVEQSFFAIDMLIEVKDVPIIGVDKFGYQCQEPLFIRTMDEKNCG
jgi:hypothetical protein